MGTAKTFDGKIDRILKAVGGKRDTDLARALGVKPQSIYGARQRGEVPATWIQIVSEKYGISADWLLFGTGPRLREERKQSLGEVMEDYFDGKEEGWSFSEEQGLQAGSPAKVNLVTTATTKAPLDQDLVMVPKVRARLSAGTGSLETSDEVDGRYAFRADWLRSKGQAGKMVLMDVTGDSMEPDIKDKDMVLIDQSQTAVIAGAIYAVGIDDEVLIKHVDKVPGRYVLRSVNKDYAPIPINLADESLNVRIIGRVVWWCREAR